MQLSPTIPRDDNQYLGRLKLCGLVDLIYFSALDCIAHAILLIDKNGEIVFKNKTAGRILQHHDGLFCDTSNKNQLKSHSKDVQTSLDAAIKQVVTAKATQSPYISHVINITRPSEKMPYLLQMSALSAQSDITKDYKAAKGIIFIKDTEAVIACSPEILKAIFKLTDSEAQIALLSMKLATIKDIADYREVNIATVKTQLNNIYEKTKTKNKAELIKLIMTLAMPL